MIDGFGSVAEWVGEAAGSAYKWTEEQFNSAECVAWSTNPRYWQIVAGIHSWRAAGKVNSAEEVRRKGKEFAKDWGIPKALSGSILSCAAKAVFEGGLAEQPARAQGSALTAGPGAASWSAQRLDVVGRGTDGAIWHRAYDNGGWSDWASLGGEFLSGPAMASWGHSRLDVVGRGTDNAIWQRTYDNGGWSEWTSLGGEFTSGLAAASWGAGRLDIVGRGTDMAIWHNGWDSNVGRWGGWSSLGGQLTSGPAASSWGSGRLDVSARGTDNAVWHRRTTTEAGVGGPPSAATSRPARRWRRGPETGSMSSRRAPTAPCGSGSTTTAGAIGSPSAASSTSARASDRTPSSPWSLGRPIALNAA